MDRSISGVGVEESENGGSCKDFFNMVDELKIIGENLLKTLAEHVSDAERPEEGACAVNANRLGDSKARESEVSESGRFEIGKFNSIWGESDTSSREVRLKEERLDEQLKSVTEHIEILEARLKEVDGLRKNVREKLHDVESKERDVELMRESMSMKSKEIEMREFEKLCKIEKREKEIESKHESLLGKFKEVEKREKDVDSMRESLGVKLKEVDKQEKELKFMCESLSEELHEVEKREKESEVMRESLRGKLKEVEKKEKETDFMRESLCEKLKEVEKREKKLEFMRGSLCGKLKDIEKRGKEMEFMRGSLCGKLKEVEKRERDVCVSHGKLKEVEKRERQVEDLHESLERQLRDVENREREVEALSEKLKRAEKIERELKFLHQKLWDLEKREREVKDLRERSREVERSEREIESLQEKLRKVEQRERELGDKHSVLDRKLRETVRREKDIEILEEKLKNVEEWERKAEVTREFIDRRLKEVERRETEVELLQEKFKNVKERAKEVDLAHASLEGRLREVENTEKEAKILFEKSKDVEKLANAVEIMHASLERRLREADERESEFVLSQNARMKELVSKKEALNAKRDEFAKEAEAANEKLKLGSHLIEKLDNALVTLDRIKSAANERFKEMQSWEATAHESLSLILNEAVSARETAEQRIAELENRERDTISSKEKTNEDLLRDFLASYKLKHDSVSPSRNSVECIEVKNQEHETNEDTELRGDEISKALSLLSDAAKLVLEATQEFYSSHLVKGDVELKLWRKHHLLLDQLHKMSPSIKPCVREAARKLAVEWKPKAIVVCAYSESMVIVFLLFVAAYNLIPCLSVEELLTLLKRVAHWKEAPKLLHKLCPQETIHGFIQNLLNEKQYLLASAYIHECKFPHIFPYPAVINSFLNHSKMLAREIRIRGNNSCEGRVEAINLETSHLKEAINHVKKFGLESELSPQGLEFQIKKLEGTKLALTKHLMRSISMGCGQVSPSAPRNTPISPAEVSSSSQSGDSRKRVATADSISVYDCWLLEMTRNAVPSHGYYGKAQQHNRARKKWRRGNHFPRPVVPHQQQRMPGPNV